MVDTDRTDQIDIAILRYHVPLEHTYIHFSEMIYYQLKID